MLALAFAGTAFAQTASDDTKQAAAEPDIVELRARFSRIPETVDNNSELRALLPQLNDIAAQTDKFITSRSAQLADLNARLGELGNAPATPGASEDPGITRQRNTLSKERNALDADVRLAKLLAIDTQQRSGDLVDQRRKMFEAQLTERAPSPLGREFWRDIGDAWPDDIARLKALGADLRASIAVARQPDHRTSVIASLIGAVLVALLGSWLAERWLVWLAARVLPPGRLRRSLLVIAIVAANVALVGLAAHGLFGILDEQRIWGAQTRKVAEAAVQSSIFIAFLVGLGRALLSIPRPSWRLPPMTDEMAARLVPYPWLIAAVAIVVWTPTQINAVVDASFAAIVATHVLTALGLTALIAAIVLRLGLPNTRRAAVMDAATAEPASADGTPAATLERPVWVGMLLSAVLVAVIAIWVLVAAGYVALASFLAGQLTWGGIVVTAFYVLFKFADDLFTALVSSKSSFGERLQKSFGFAPQTLDQASVVLSGLSRVALFFYMIIALAEPLGSSPGEVFQRSGKLGAGLKIGEFELVPGAIFSAVAVAAGGFLALRIFKRWLERRYLPNTTLEPGMQSSLTTLLGYVGGVLVIAFALSALGIGINRIAWVASALSVGIGFGLQAIVQNFISGLILLAERPVKVGDWVVLGTAEGDVRRINVRATEIQLGDRSTLIVPNSEFITKTVRNMTLTNAEGRVLIRLPMPLTTDANRARDVMLTACAGHTGVLATPAPSVTLDGIESGFLIFQVIAYVQSPRLAGGVRSDLLFTILDGLKAAQLPLMAYAAPPAPTAESVAAPVAPVPPVAAPLPGTASTAGNSGALATPGLSNG
ncbi:mechanosensitive ion channel family protein [soil metagenome]